MNLPPLPDNWEKKGLILIGFVFIITIIYALNPFTGTPTNNSSDQTFQPGSPIPFPKLTTNKNTSNNTNNTNITFKITKEQAEKIATQAWPSYTVGTPLQGTIIVNNTNYNVWIVPLTKQNTASKTIYIDGNTGVIVLDI